MHLTPSLNFNGQCEEAFKFYETCLGGKIEMMLTHGDAPTARQVPVESHKSIMHARLIVGDAMLMGSDAPPDRYRPMQGSYVSLIVDQPADADRIFEALAENGSVQMQLVETFWAARFGVVVDRFGIAWMVNCTLPGGL